MACRTVLRSVFLSEQWRPASSGAGLSCSSSSAAAAAAAATSSSSFLRSSPRLSLRSRPVRVLVGAPLRCSHGEAGAVSSSSSSPGELDPPQEAVLKAISVSKSEGRVSQTTNVVMGGTVTDDSTNEWLALDQKVNSYPTVRGFTAIGTGGDDFVHSMVVAVESVLEQQIPEAFHGKLPTQDNLKRKGMHIVNRCILCCSHEETISHLYFECHYTTWIWEEILGRFDLHRQPKIGLHQEVEKLKHEFPAKSIFFQLIKVTLKASIWWIWRERCTHLFENTRRPKVQILIDILYDTRCCLEGKVKEGSTLRERNIMTRFNFQMQ